MVPCLLSAIRSPFVPADDVFGRWHPVDLAAHIAQAAIGQAGLEAGALHELWVGCEEPVGAQGADMARAIVLTAGWPDSISGTVLDRGESSGSAALHAAAAAIDAGQVETALVLGVHSASTVNPGASALGRTYGRPCGDGPAARVADHGGLLPAPRQAEAAAVAAGIDRAVQDGWTRRSHQRRHDAASPAIAATDARPANGTAVQRGSSVITDSLRPVPLDAADLPPMFDDRGTVTSASFAPPADGVAAVVLGRSTSTGLAALIGTGRAAGHPLDPVGGLEHAVERALTTAELPVDSITTWHLSERTAAAALLAAAALQRLGVDPALVNPLGGSLAVGDAGAADDLRLTVDGLAAATPGDHIACISYGMTGAAVSVWTRAEEFSGRTTPTR